MSDIETVETPMVRILDPDTFKELKKAQVAQKEHYERLEKQALKGPSPTLTDNSLGAREEHQIKEASRTAFGAMIVDNYSSAIKVNSIIDADGEETEDYTWWERNKMDKKLLVMLRDFFTGGAGVFELLRDRNGKVVAEVRSPKKVAVFFYDRVNDDFASFAIMDQGLRVYAVYDDAVRYTFVKQKGRDNYKLVAADFHGFPVCPFFEVADISSSDGATYGEIELLAPSLDAMRIIQNAFIGGTYWQGKKTLVIENVDMTSKINVDGEELNAGDYLRDELTTGDSSYILLPAPEATQGASPPKLAQTQEANLGQLSESVKEMKNTLAALSGLPLSIFDPSGTPSTAEGSVQAIQPLKRKMENKRTAVSDGLLTMLQVVAELEGREWTYKERILWRLDDEVSLNSLSDTIAKMKAAGLPLSWIVSTVIAQGNFGPQKIKELQDAIEAEEEKQSQFGNLLLGAGNGSTDQVV